MYSSEVFKTAMRILEDRRDRNKYETEKRRDEIKEKFPEYLELKKELMKAIGNHASLIGSKNSKSVSEIKKKISEIEAKKKKLLTDNGYPANYLDDIYTCDKCKDTGYILNKKCECLDKILCKIASEKSNMNNLFEEQNFDKFDIKMFSEDKINGISPRENMCKILNHVNSFIENFDCERTKSLFFTGNPGVGKTFLSSCIAKCLLEKGKNVLYMPVSSVISALSDGQFSGSSEAENLYGTELLIIDDFGTEFKTSYTLPAIYELINKRLINNKKMIISTNLSMAEIKEIYSERLLSRLLGEFMILEFIGEDLRCGKLLK